MSTDEHRALIEAMVDAVNQGDADRFAAYYAEDVVVRLMGSGTTWTGHDAIRRWITEFFTEFEGAANEVVGIHLSGNVVVLEIVARGRRRSDAPGMPAGTEMNRPEAFVYHLRDCLISEVRAY